MKTFGEIVKSRREELGATQAELARRVCVSKSKVVDIERGRTLPKDLDFITRYADALAWDAKDLWAIVLRENNSRFARMPSGLWEEFGDWMLSESESISAQEADDEIDEVPPKSYRDVERHAEEVAEYLFPKQVRSGTAIPVLKVLTYSPQDAMDYALSRSDSSTKERGLKLRFDTFTIGRGEASPRQEEGRTGFDPETKTVTVKLRMDVLKRAERGEGRSRFTAAHELGHALFHTGSLVEAGGQLFRDALHTASEKLPDDIPIYCSPEYQANCWAGAFLMPETAVRAFLKRKDDAEQDAPIRELARQFEVSVQAARIRLEKLLPRLVRAKGGD